MNQLLLSHFIVEREFEHEGAKHKRIYTLGMWPYAPWDEIESALEEFKTQFETMKAAQAEQLKAKEEADKAASEAAPVEAEVVS